MDCIKGFRFRNPNEKKGKDHGEVEVGKNIIRMHYVRKKSCLIKEIIEVQIKFYRHKRQKFTKQNIIILIFFRN